ncbi:MAG: hypothetical protein JKY62_00500 [Desulfocapsa sp.]|uniref:Uncharacterized protein n=1 Tax=Desulfotalea psychrophila TaxID=84980 RepID=A0ABS3ASG9_9BACT|nr:hypothetical protein [Desulfocapsa sp.]MBN4045960.1 hypothetical protein [bacterium AH-315-P11]MBN4064079.1 hypothetical protein [bacterium AH-315-I07]MBN4068069.1 hypothetical protein [Desulfotalea psychrophila]
MNKYKWLNKEETEIRRLSDSATISENGNGGQEFKDYLAHGGQVDPWRTVEEILEAALAEKRQELRDEKNRRVAAVIGSSDSRKKDKILARTIKLLRRETKNKATPQEVAELDSMEALDDLLDDLDNDLDTAEAWLEDPARTLEQIQGYDVVTEPGW